MEESKRYIMFVALGGVVLGVVIAVVVASFFGHGSGAGVGGGVTGPSGAGATVVQPGAKSADCTVTNAQATISGDSMKGILSDGQKVTVLQNYYGCHDVTRGDIVVYDDGIRPIVKRMVGLSGDTFAVAAKAGTDGWNILVNGAVLKNAQGVDYLVSHQRSLMIDLYVSSGHGVIPADDYLILGNDPAGTEDSTQFGLVSKGGLVGKVQM